MNYVDSLHVHSCTEVTQVSPILIDLVQVCANEEGQLNVPL